ncbi:MAG: SCO6745 family protein [Acidimicrobiia bacterium]
MDDTKLRHVARRVRDLIEPLAASVYFAPEVHRAFEALGFGPGTVARSGLHYTDLPAYFTSRGACLGEVPGEVVAAAFGVFPPASVVPAVDEGWKTAAREAILAARLEGQSEALAKVLPDRSGVARATELLRRMADAGFEGGHHLFAGLRSLPWPDDELTEDGRELREEIEWMTDLQERSLCAAIGDDMDDLLTILEPWARAIVEAQYYPVAPVKP